MIPERCRRWCGWLLISIGCLLPSDNQLFAQALSNPSPKPAPKSARQTSSPTRFRVVHPRRRHARRIARPRMRRPVRPRTTTLLAPAVLPASSPPIFFAYSAQDRPPAPIVEMEQDVYSFEPADNGAGPMWCSGSTCLVRARDDVFASGLETLKDQPPLNNCRWTLWHARATTWEPLQFDPEGRTREPCPLVVFPDDGRFLLSANPTLNADGRAGGGPARPELLLFSVTKAAAPPVRVLPEWSGRPAFTEHSYRSFAADGPNHELILFQNLGDTHAEWTLRGSDGGWTAHGQLQWPTDTNHAAQPVVRVCYPDVALVDRAVYFAGVSDIIEPNPAWRAFKKQLTGRDWDYDFRRFFFTWSEDITGGGFHEWVELASRERTCGWITPGDLWVDGDDVVHVVWTERALDERLRAKFFPGEKQRYELNYAQVRDGEVLLRQTLAFAEEGKGNEIPGLARFQVTPDGRLFVFYYVNGTDAAGQAISENRLIELRPDGTTSPPMKVPLKHPLTSFFTASTRAGCLPSKTLDLLGTRAGNSDTISYARIRLW